MERRTEYSEAELLESHDFDEPLFAGGVRCHGGGNSAGSYVSPRTKHRGPAILAWQAQHREQFGQEVQRERPDRSDLGRVAPELVGSKPGGGEAQRSS